MLLRSKHILYALFIVMLVVFFDQITKYLVRSSVDPFETISLLPVLNLVNVQNKGAAFGMFRSLGNTFFIVISIVAILFIIWVIITNKENYLIFSLLAGGAAGNLTDRILFGAVTDFMDLHIAQYHWPAFNVADASLTLGILFIIIQLFRKKG
jgi:signal peptidase II